MTKSLHQKSEIQISFHSNLFGVFFCQEFFGVEQTDIYDKKELSRAVSSCGVLFNPNIGLGLSDLQAHSTRIPMGHSRFWKYRERSCF